jgi:hypothetical protein
MKPREYLLMQECVELGVSYGIRRAHKHTDDPGNAGLHLRLTQPCPQPVGA